MNKNIFYRWQITEWLISVLVFLVLTWFTYGILIEAPYSGFDFSPVDGHITDIFVDAGHQPSLQVGDFLVKVGPVSWDDFRQNRRLTFFENVQMGETVTIVINRGGKKLDIQWKFPGFNKTEFQERFFNIWWLAYFFWFFGFMVQLLVRPKDTRWWLFIAATYLTAFWLITGSLSHWRLLESSALLHAVSWVILPVYLHLHWVFPHPLGKISKVAWGFIYLASISFAAGELTQSLPRSLYIFAFLLALIGSFILEIIHFTRQADQRREVILLTVSILIALAPSIGFGFIVMAGGSPYTGPMALFALPLMPLAYIYIIYRRHLGGLEVRVNRIASAYAFLILLGTVLILLVTTVMQQPIAHEIWVFIAMTTSLVTALIAIVFFPVFQAFVEQRFLGIKLPYQNLQEAHSNAITASTSIPDLLQFLNDRVFPSLLVRQYAFIHISSGGLKSLLIKNVAANQLPNKSDIDTLISKAGIHSPAFSSTNEWIRLILPLKVGDAFIGFWLLGRRDPDDYYPQAEIPILQSIANQTAIAFSNILHAEQLRKMYQSDIERYEKERMRLALELHDSILNELAFLRTNVDEASLSPKFQTSYEEVTGRLREIVSDLRPPMLMYGIVPAINEFADNLMERNGDKIKIIVDIRTGEDRLPQSIEQHLFRIVQEACENALRHAQAKNISMSGVLVPRQIDLAIEDNGTGFEPQLELGSLIANKHFGLAGMVERAHLIGAEINIQSEPNTGTRIHVMRTDDLDKK